MIKKGKLIIIDGIDGAGKTIQTKLLVNFLKSFNKKVILSSEPKNKRLIYLINKESKSSLTDLFLFLTDRNLHYQKINLLLKKGFIIISDRSFPSTWSYQYYASELKKIIPENFFLKLDRLSRFNLEPDLVLILDLRPEIAIQRLKLKTGKSSLTKFERLKFLRKVRRGFLLLAKKFNWSIIDAEKSLTEVHLLITKEVKSILKLR